MKIIIVGAGRIGTNLAKTLAQEDNEVYLIEGNKEIATKIAEKVDAKVIIGSGTDPVNLQKASVREADLVLAVTTSDETNLVVCELADLYGAKRCIARVRNASLRESIKELGLSKFNVYEIINPELLAAQTIIKTIETPGASEAAEFANGKILLRGFDIQKTSPLCGIKLTDISDDDFPWPFLIVAVVRKNEVTIPKGDTTIQEKDHIFVLLPAPSLPEFITFVNPEMKMPNKIVIYGATMIGIYVATTLSRRFKNILLIEEDAEAARELAGNLPDVRIFEGSASDSDILTECGIEATDVFIATTENDHSNFVSSVLAKQMGAKIAIITTQRPEFTKIVDAVSIDVIINPQLLAVDQILRLARGKGVSCVTKFMDCDAEAIELTPEEGSPITKDVLKNVKLPKNSIIGAVYDPAHVHLANGNTQIKPGEKVIAFCQEAALKKLQELFIK